MNSWFEHAILYHIYAPGACGAPRHNDGVSPCVPRLASVHPWLDHIRELGATAILLGPVCESTSHGYDTVDLSRVDRRLGDDRTLAGLIDAAHDRGLRVLLDAVFGHVGRGFPAFRDLQARGRESAHAGWFSGVDFERRSRLGDPFTYDCWRDAHELVRLNLKNPAVREHLIAAVDGWVERWRIDGLRLDSADWIDDGFHAELRAHCDGRHPALALFGEVVHGDYRRFAGPGRLHGVTDYELHKGLWSSLRDRNLFEVAYTLNRQFGPDGLYRGLPLVQFADNHDVDRAVEQVGRRELLFPLYCLLFTIPGVPAIYQGSEWGIHGRRTVTDDTALRPCLSLETLRREAGPELPAAIRRLARLRRELPALADGDYLQLHVGPEQFAFLRRRNGETVVVAVNAAPGEATVHLSLPGVSRAELVEVLNPPDRFRLEGGAARVTVPGGWARVMRLEDPC
ncbi:MAG: alpha-amylase [Deltaproteobacteria bacterium HGW-Deltaproteobacteria-22]|nr:MAG: alpha-amylase [Deltaproteobacteria bacterium HGW-Deltaproteobacteria-22]